MHILHITNDFGGTEVYRNLYQHLDNLGIQQTIFVPLNTRVRYRKGNHDFGFKTIGSNIIYSTSQRWYHRYFYKDKISVVSKDLEALVDLKNVSIIHTGTLCMTGAVAFEISKKYDKPYIVSVRNTDINTYFKKMWWKRKYFHQILLSAKNVVFISPQYKKKCFEQYFDPTITLKLEEKTLIIPNGIASHFLINQKKVQKELHNPIRIVYAGSYKNNKNLLRLIKAIDLLRGRKLNVTLTAIGRSLPNRKISKRYIDKINQEVTGKDYISLVDFKEKEGLCIAYNDADLFAMPSILETFGLSYVEALSQGLPIVYTKGQGFDGFYKNGEVGYAVNALDIVDIANGIESVISNYSNLSKNITRLPLSVDFDWNHISARYIDLYKSILNSKK